MSSKAAINKTNDKKIFTFWEPSDNLPGYLKLCIETWSKFLPEYEIVILDYKSLDDWLGKDYFDPYLYKNFSLPIQADAIRCALLEKYGGLWLDTDTIITSDSITDIISVDSDLILFNYLICFIYARKNSKILKKWCRWNHKKIAIKKKSKNLFNFLFKYSFYRKFKAWDYLGESILKRILKNKSQKDYYPLDPKGIFPEKKYSEESCAAMKRVENYRFFYFENDFSEYAARNNSGMICLHNSWTPEEFNAMNETEFLKTNNTVSNLIKSILKNNSSSQKAF